MNSTAQLWIEGFSATLLLGLLWQQPDVAALRFWVAASAFGLVAALLPSLTRAPVVAGSLVLLVVSAQLACIATGFLRAGSRTKLLHYVVPGFSLLGLLLVLLSHGSQRWIGASLHLLQLLLLAMLTFFLNEHRKRHPKTVLLIEAPLLLGILREALLVSLAMPWLHAMQPLHTGFQPLLSATVLLAPAAGTLALLFAAAEQSSLSFRQVQQKCEDLRQLLESVAYGICRVDCGGRINFANAAASEMLDLDCDGTGEAETDTGIWIQEKLRAQDDEFSIRAIGEFVIRPTAPVDRATALIPSPNRPAISVQWSSLPLVQAGQVVGATVSLHDITELEATARFIRFRAELLEMIAHHKPQEEIIRLLITATEQRLIGYCCSVLICDGDFFRVVTSPRIPEAFRSALRSVHCNRLPLTVDASGAVELKNWDDTLRVIARLHGYSITRCEPMVSTANELLGTVVLNHLSETSLEPSDTRILREAARLGALALEHHNSYQRLLHQGYHDPLTGLPNRLLLADRLKQAMARADRNETQVAYLSIDLDRFKDINDTLGHDAGDLFLRQISARMAARVRASDTLARNGGDEFTLILSDLQDARDAGRVADSLSASLTEPFVIEDHTLYGSASIGIAMYPRDAGDAATLQRNADRAMYRAKGQGRNLVRFYAGDESSEDPNRIEIELYLHRAIEQKSFSLCFQPQYTCDHQLEGLEALLRFQHPKLGMVPPSRLIPMAEENGLILPIGDWVLHEVCRQIREWQEQGLRTVRVALNVSPLQLARGDFARSVANAIRNSSVKPEMLEIELTEGVLMSSVPDAERQIAELARLGLHLSVDDFGTGYSCLSYLHQLPLHTVKIDRSFICRMLEPDGTRCIVEAIITLARNLGLRTVAEGVETEEQLRLLRAVGCDLIQGYLFSKPLSALDTTALLWKNTLGDSSSNSGEGKMALRPPLPRWAQLSRRRPD